MLTLSQAAADALFLERNEQGMPDTSVLRVAVADASQNGSEPAIGLGFVSHPEAGDHTAVSHGMRLCVAADPVDDLDDVEIDLLTVGETAELILVRAR